MRDDAIRRRCRRIGLKIGTSSSWECRVSARDWRWKSAAVKFVCEINLCHCVYVCVFFTEKMDALMYLEPVLRSKKEQLTPQEVYLMQAWKIRAKRDFFVGSFGGGFAAWLATKRLQGLPRTAICAGAAATTGVWLLTKSLESTVEYFLSLQGTRVQGELANIMLKKHQNDPWVHRRVFKHFYPEVVFTDSSVDRPVQRWRYRNFFGDSVTPESTPHSEETDSKESDVKMTTMSTTQAYVNASDHTVGNGSPFDLVLGLPESAEDVPQPDALRSLSRRQTRREKRLQRRHRRHHQEESEI